MTKRNIKPTAMRELVINVLMIQQTAVSLADLEKMFDIVDRVTFYRTLRTFEKNRLIHSVDDRTGSLFVTGSARDACRLMPPSMAFLIRAV